MRKCFSLSCYSTPTYFSFQLAPSTHTHKHKHMAQGAISYFRVFVCMIPGLPIKPMGVAHVAHLINTLLKCERTMDKELNCLRVFSCCLPAGMPPFSASIITAYVNLSNRNGFSAYLLSNAMTHHTFLVSHFTIINTVLICQ